MSRVFSHHPILLVHPDRPEAAYLRDRLVTEGVRHPIVISPSIDDAKDYLFAATVAAPLQARFLPCLALLDEKLGEEDVRDLANWARSQPALSSLHLVRLTSDHGPAGASEPRGLPWAVPEAIRADGPLDALRTLIERVCPPVAETP
ncbi:MAG TPA: hypothetical protein VHE61_05215 [Opitutaceae bacterium]|nr:hypothetical protein [Opitutaceae bacterium]